MLSHTLLIIPLALLYLTPPLHAQAPDSVLLAPLQNDPEPTSPLDLLLPAFLRISYATRTWIRDSLPPSSDSLSDLDRLDMIYLRALNEADGDQGIAFVAAAVASFEHRTIPLKWGIDIPLTLESEEKFNRRVERLPRDLFADMVGGDDRDKIQHFFASAWMAWVLESPEAADMVGIAIEAGEEILLQGGVNDPRDIRANRLGQLFVELLRTHPDALPSVMFRAWNREYRRRGGI